MGELYKESDLRTTPSFSHFPNVLLDKLMVSLRHFKLGLVHWILILDMDLVFVVPGQSKVIFVQADGILMFEQDVDVSLFEFIWNL